MKYKYLLFDMDGTLLDFDRSAALSLEETITNCGVTFRAEMCDIFYQINDELWREYERGTLTRDKLLLRRAECFLQAIESTADPMNFVEWFPKNLEKQAVLVFGAKELCEELYRRGYHMAIVTNGVVIQHGRLKRSGLEPYFSDLFISAEIGYQKPDARFFDVVLERLGNPDPAKCLVIGDSLTSDIRGANNAGIPCCWYNPRAKENDAGVTFDYEIHTLEELLVLLL